MTLGRMFPSRGQQAPTRLLTFISSPGLNSSRACTPSRRRDISPCMPVSFTYRPNDAEDRGSHTMRQSTLGLATLLCVLLTLSLAGAFGREAPDVEMPEADIDALAAPITRSCTFGAPGDGCIFDVVATGGGNLQVDTRARATGELWRTPVAIVGTKTVLSTVGTGSTSSFTGLVKRTVASGKSYNVAVLYEAPLPGTFPTTVED